MAALDFPTTPSNGQTYTPVGSAITYTYSSSKGSWQGSLSGSTGLSSLITVADESSDTTCFPLFVTAATGDLGPKSRTNRFTFNSSSGLLVATGITADLTGTFGVDLGSDAEGDTYYRDSSGNFVRLARGSDDHVLTMNGNVPNWEAASGGGASALDDLSDVKFEGANFTDSIKIGDVTTGTLSSAARNIILGKDAGNSITTANDCIIIGDSTQVNISDSIDSVIIGGNSAANI